jgi:hypothetical protein
MTVQCRWKRNTLSAAGRKEERAVSEWIPGVLHSTRAAFGIFEVVTTRDLFHIRRRRLWNLSGESM